MLLLSFRMVGMSIISITYYADNETLYIHFTTNRIICIISITYYADNETSYRP